MVQGFERSVLALCGVYATDDAVPTTRRRVHGKALKMRHAHKGVVLVLLCAAQFMVVLDIAIVNVALPSIRRDLGIERGTLQWVVIAYGLTLGGFLLLGGRTADLLGRRRTLLTGLALFSSASLLAGVAGSAGSLIGARLCRASERR
jgi:MFS family permease